MKNKEISEIDVMQYLPDEAHIGTTSFGVGGFPEQLFAGLGEYYKQHQQPKNVSVYTTGGVGGGKGRGLDHLIAPGLLKRFVGSHLAGSPLANQAAQNNEFELFEIPQGIMGKLYRDQAGQGPGVFSQVGMGSFIDPKQQGGKLNQAANQAPAIIESIELNNERWLHYLPLNINVAMIKATYADQAGNLSITHESAELESLALATAAHNANGLVIAQVEAVVENHSLPAKEVIIPGALVDYVVVATEEKYHMQTAATYYDPALSNEIRVPLEKQHDFDLSPKKAIVRRASQEIPEGSIVNLGNGIASYVGEVIAEANKIENYHLTTDLGSFGGLPATGRNYAPNYNADAVINTEDMFNLYHGQGLDVAVLGFGQMNQIGDMNTTKFGDYFFGPGGMIDISHGAKKIIFVGTFVVKGETVIEDGQLVIKEEGIKPKFVRELPLITFSAEYARARGTEILVITDRAVFDFTKEGKMRLIEIAPGMDLEEDILQWMEFEPIVATNLKKMDSTLFQYEWSLEN